MKSLFFEEQGKYEDLRFIYRNTVHISAEPLNNVKNCSNEQQIEYLWYLRGVEY